MKENTLAVPIAIIIAALIVGGAIFFVNRGPAGPADTTPTTFEEPEPITEDEHILGNPNADIVFIEFSDFECPFCSAFHVTMNALIAEFGPSGRAAWAYRHFPLPINTHENAPKIAEGSECAAELGGNEAFWAYTNGMFAQDVPNVATPLSVIPAIAEAAGLDVSAFTQCLDSGKYAKKVTAQFEDARDAGGNGTPYTVAILQEKITEGQRSDIRLLANQIQIPANLIRYSENETAISFSGNLPIEFMRAITQVLLGLPVGDAPIESNTTEAEVTDESELETE